MKTNIHGWTYLELKAEVKRLSNELMLNANALSLRAERDRLQNVVDCLDALQPQHQG